MTEQKILPAPLDRDELLTLVRLALDEDLRYGPDITSTATVPADAVAKASVVSRSSGTVAGIDVGLLVLDEVIGAGNYEVVDRVADGTRVAPGQSVLTVVAPTRPSHGRAHDAQPRLPSLGNRHGDITVGRRHRRHSCQSAGQPKDTARTAFSAEICSPRGRRRQPPHGIG